MKSKDDSKSKAYAPIHSTTKDWPVVQLSKNRKEFIEEVVQATISKVIANNKQPQALRDELENTLYLERLRIRQNPWEVDPSDERSFFKSIQHELVELVGQENTAVSEKEILERIVRRYATEIAGNFKRSRYKLAREIVKFGFARLLNATRVKRFGAFFRNEYTLRDKIQITGKIKKLRKLAKLGTVVMVPTHFSNLDSILIGWIIHVLGLPAFIYGAGLNLFNIKILAYFMNSLGAYKVDRRKKNPIYLETLKMYSNLALQRGTHSLFFPGGTRSRSGMIEKELKLGLLGTAIEAQRQLFLDHPDGTAKKIFIVPVTINYNFVLEAPSLIKQELQRVGQERFYQESDEYSTSFKMIKFLLKFFTKGSDISISIGPGLDVVGNYVDDEGNSIDRQGRFINTRDYFKFQGELNVNEQREHEYTRMLSEVIVDEFHAINRVFASHLVAFVAFIMWRKRFSKLDLYDFLRLPEEEMMIDYDEFEVNFKKCLKRIKKLKKKRRLNMAAHLKGDIKEVIEYGINNVGMYHDRRPLLLKDGKIVTQDLNTLYFYHNRTVGYDLEKVFK